MNLLNNIKDITLWWGYEDVVVFLDKSGSKYFYALLRGIVVILF